MDGATLTAKIYGGYGKAADRIGFPCSVYRSTSMLSPIARANRVLTDFNASFTTGFGFKNYGKPKTADCIAILDGTKVRIGDWITGEAGVFYIADMQPTLPISAVQCNRLVSITRPGYSLVSSTPTAETSIATSFPVFGMTAGRGKTPTGVPVQTDADSGIHGMEFYINNHTAGGILVNDVITDEVGQRFIIDSAALSAFGYIVQTHAYTSVAEVLVRMLNDKGRSVTLRSYTLGTYSTATDTVTGGSTADTTRRAAIIDYDMASLGMEFAPGTTILAGDKRCIMDAVAAVNIQDHVIIDGVNYSIKNLKTWNYGGSTVSAYEMLLRR